MTEYLVITTIGLSDVLAEILYEMFNISKPKSVYFNDELLNKFSQIATDVRTRKIDNMIKKIHKSKEFNYMKNLCNYAKHNSVVELRRIVLKNQRLNFYISGFKQKEHKYCKKSINDISTFHYNLSYCYTIST